MTRKLQKPVIISLVAMLLCAALMLGGIYLFRPSVARADVTVSVWDGDLEKAGWGGAEKAVKPDDYIVNADNKTISIGSAAALAYFSHEVYVDAAHILDGFTVKLECDIDLNNKLWAPIGTTQRSYTPSIRFSGVFDGNGKTIYNFSSEEYLANIKYDTDYYVDGGNGTKLPFDHDGKEYCYGLFGVVFDATIKNLSVRNIKVNLEIKSVGSFDFIADSAGSIVGYAVGNFTMENCIAGANNEDDSLLITSTGDPAVGGLVGRIYGCNGTSERTPYQKVSFTNCVNYVKIALQSTPDKVSGKVGGIVGYTNFFNDYKIVGCANYGELYGRYCAGMTGYVTNNNCSLGDMTVSDCVNYGKISACRDNGNAAASGIVGIWQFSEKKSDGTPVSIGAMTMKRCYNYGAVACDFWYSAGMIAWLQMYESHSESVSVTDCFNYGSITVTKSADKTTSPIAGGLIGHINSESPILSGGNFGLITNDTDAGSKGVCVGDKSVAALYFIDATSTKTTSVTNSTPATTTATLMLSEDGKTVIGIESVPESNFKVEIPASAENIALGAFAGMSGLVEVTFANGSELKEIGDWAFAGTGINNIEIPASVEEIGIAAFADCVYLNYITLSDNADRIAFGNCIVNSGAYIIANSQTQYAALKTKLADKSYADNLVYIVTIQYNYFGTVADSETRLFGKDYAVEFDSGRWVTSDSPSLGTTKTGTAQWYASEDGAGSVLTVNGVNGLLASEDCGEIINLYTFDIVIFIARDDLVYNGKEYGMTELNPLLYVSSSYITPSMTASIIGYTDANGVAASETNLPNKVCNAGEYTVQIVDGSDTYEFTISVARATINLADYANLSWRLKQVGSTATDRELLSGSGMTLYIYVDSNGNEYPSSTVLTNEQITDLKLSATYTTKTVLYSAVRNRNEEVTIEIADNDAYSVKHSANTGTNIGAYGASATLTASANYIFVAGNVNAMRGMTVSVSEDGKTAVVSKIWYIVNLSNWLVTTGGEDYTIANHAYLDCVTVSAPSLYYTGVGGTISMTLYRNGTKIGDIFGVTDFGKYINDVMPSGSYRLVVIADGVTSEEYDENDTERENPIYVYHNGFTETIEFTVFKRNLPLLDELNTALKGKTFTYKWEENTSHLYDGDATAVVENYLAGVANTSRIGTVWENYANLYCGFAITFNLASMQSDNYFTADSAEVATADAGRYVVYYQISALNYVSSLEALDSGDVRQNYCFYVVNVREIALPIVLSKEYNGKTLTADIYDNLYYKVKTNDGGVNVGQYNVVLEFYTPDYYMWEGQTIQNKTATYTLKFDITKANNEWTSTLGITTWMVGKYDQIELPEGVDFTVVASARIGDVGITLVDANDAENILYDGANATADLNSILSGLKVGTYILTASVAGTDNIYDLSDFIIFQVFPPEGLPWWGTLSITAGALALAAVIILILWKAKVFEILTDKISLAITTRATVDATIAAVRATKKAEEADAHKRKVEARERLQASREAERNKSPEQKAQELQAKAEATATQADKLRARADKMREQADKLADNAEQVTDDASKEG